MKDKFNKALHQTTAVFVTVLPILCGILLLLSLLHQLFHDSYQSWFSGNYLLDPLIGALAGSISFGIPITIAPAIKQSRHSMAQNLKSRVIRGLRSTS